MPASQTHNEIVLRPPPGTRFYVYGSDVHLQCERGKERECVTWLRQWIDAYVEPEAVKAEERAKALAQFQAVEKEKSAREEIEALLKSVPETVNQEQVLRIREIVEGISIVKAQEAAQKVGLNQPIHEQPMLPSIPLDPQPKGEP